MQAGDRYGFELGGVSDDTVWNEMYGSLTVGIQNGFSRLLARLTLSASNAAGERSPAVSVIVWVGSAAKRTR